MHGNMMLLREGAISAFVLGDWSSLDIIRGTLPPSSLVNVGKTNGSNHRSRACCLVETTNVKDQDTRTNVGQYSQWSSRRKQSYMTGSSQNYGCKGKGFDVTARESPRAVSSSWYARFCSACSVETKRNGEHYI